MTITCNIGGRNHGDAEPAFAADFLSFNKGIWGVSAAFLARQCEINQLYECNYPCAVTLAYSGAFCSVQVKTASKSLQTCLRQKMSQRVVSCVSFSFCRRKSPGFNWRREDVRRSPTRSGKLIRMSRIKAFERGIASTLNNLAEVFDAMTIAFISFFLFPKAPPGHQESSNQILLSMFQVLAQGPTVSELGDGLP